MDYRWIGALVVGVVVLGVYLALRDSPIALGMVVGGITLITLGGIRLKDSFTSGRLDGREMWSLLTLFGVGLFFLWLAQQSA